MDISRVSNYRKLQVLKEAYRYINRDIADSLKLQTSIPKGGLPLFSMRAQETRFTWLNQGCKRQWSLLMCKHQVKKPTLNAYAILILIVILQWFGGRLCHN